LYAVVFLIILTNNFIAGKMLGCLLGKCSGSIRSIVRELPVIASCGEHYFPISTFCIFAPEAHPKSMGRVVTGSPFTWMKSDSLFLGLIKMY